MNIQSTSWKQGSVLVLLGKRNDLIFCDLSSSDFEVMDAACEKEPSST
jgi:hypothetical protein